MNQILPNSTFQEYLEKESLFCPVCLEPFDLSDNFHTPARIGACIHAICLECFKNYEQNVCPLCQEPLKKSHKVNKHPLVIQLIESVKKTWTMINEANRQQRALAPLQVPAGLVLDPVMHAVMNSWLMQ